MAYTPVTSDGLESAQIRLVIKRLRQAVDNAEKELSTNTKDKNLIAKAMLTSALLEANDNLDMITEIKKENIL